MAALSVMGLLMAVLGLYGVMAYSVQQRTGEIGLRMALGARPGHIARLTLKEGGFLALVGIVAGSIGALGLNRILSSMLYEVKTAELDTLVLVAILVGVTSLIACYIPARKASVVDPTIALRSE